jgi:hypothetical protein
MPPCGFLIESLQNNANIEIRISKQIRISKAEAHAGGREEADAGDAEQQGERVTELKT